MQENNEGHFLLQAFLQQELIMGYGKDSGALKGQERVMGEGERVGVRISVLQAFLLFP